MRVRSFGALLLTAALAASLSGTPAARGIVTAADAGAAPSALGVLAFGPGNVLFAADPQAAAIYAFDLGASAAGAGAGTPGAADVPNLDAKLAAVLGTDVSQVAIADLAVHPQTRNVYLAAMRGTGAAATPALVRLDGAGRLDVVALGGLKYTSVTLPNAPVANPQARRDPRTASITDMAFDNGQLIVAGLSNEEFSSKLRAVKYPFSQVDPGTSVEIFHGNHGAVETRSPVYAFVPYTIAGTKQIVAGYLCTPLVTFPMTSLTSAPGAKVRGTTIAELGSGNRPIDMIVYSRGGQDYLLMSNTSRGVMKIPTASFAGASGITAKVAETTAGVPFETLAELKGVEHLDRVGADKVAVLAKADTGVSLRTIPLP
jgi:hypothetical protein